MVMVSLPEKKIIENIFRNSTLMYVICFLTLIILNDAPSIINIGLKSLILFVIILIYATGIYLISDIDTFEKINPLVITGVMFISGLILIFTFALLYYVPTPNNSISSIHGYELEFFDHIYFSGVTLVSLGYGDILPQGNFYKFLSIFQVFYGLIFVTTLFSLLVSNFNKSLEQAKWKLVSKSSIELIRHTLEQIQKSVFHIFLKDFKPISILKLRVEPITQHQKQEFKQHMEAILNNTKHVEIDLKTIQELNTDIHTPLHSYLMELSQKINDMEIRYSPNLPPQLHKILIDLQIELKTIVEILAHIEILKTQATTQMLHDSIKRILLLIHEFNEEN
ncbi:MAG: potassium channel family protein [Nanoarchaeota archaeon]|nr:potassium channel family protein [Nanoarchaeota archaeon]